MDDKVTISTFQLFKMYPGQQSAKHAPRVDESMRGAI